jgi:hypothetical protein
VAETSVLKTQQTKSPGFCPHYFQPKDMKLHSYETQQSICKRRKKSHQALCKKIAEKVRDFSNVCAKTLEKRTN